jgi:endonuclease/exonuclease/phosphatase family metal-dependent hydrolase
MKPWLSKILIILAVLFLVLGITGFALLRLLNYFPKPVMPAELTCKANAPTLSTKKKQSLRILSWNVQYSASRNYHFFYDGGKAVIASKKDVDATIAKLIAVVKEYNPDIVLWQEVDVNSKRSAYTDQIALLQKGLSYPCQAHAPYFKSKFVPVPSPGNAIGQVDTRLVVFSKYKIDSATRHALPMLQESFLRRAFNLKRAVLEVSLPLAEGGHLRLFDTHFSAFSYGDGTLAKQVAKFSELLNTAKKKGDYWLAAGDLNLLPPGDNPNRLKKEKTLYADKNNPIEPLFKSFKNALPLAEYKKNPDKHNTYLLYGEKKTDRWIDHIFVSDLFDVTSYAVPQKHYNISDHLPIVVDLKWKEKK